MGGTQSVAWGGVNLPREPWQGRTLVSRGRKRLVGVFAKVQSEHVIGVFKHYVISDEASCTEPVSVP